jgi:phosphoserine phosphatase RsbU/P
VTLDLAPGATVCFFTDGLVEARRNGVPVGPERVERILADAPEDAEALIAAVAAVVDELNDDVAVCLLHRPADSLELSAELVESSAGGVLAR